MNLRDLEYIVAIERYGNFGKAAQACHVSQPALSSQVKKLEERLGVELFIRSNQMVSPTEAGCRIISTAREMQRSARQINDMAAEYRDPLSVPLKIGIFPTLAPFVVPYVTKSVKDVSAKMKLIYREKPTANLIMEMRDRTIDIAMVSGPIDAPGCDFTPVFKEKLYLIVADNHRLSNQDVVKADEIPRDELLLLDNDHCLRNEAISLCQEKQIGLDLQEDMSATSLLTASQYIADGYGCTLVPELGMPFIGRANPRIRFIAIDDDRFVRKIGFLSRKGCARKHILDALCNQMRNQPPENVTVLH